MQAFNRHPTNNRVYVLQALGSVFHVTKQGHGHYFNNRGTRCKSTKRYVAVERITRGRVLSKPHLHELLATMQKLNLLKDVQASLDSNW